MTSQQLHPGESVKHLCQQSILHPIVSCDHIIVPCVLSMLADEAFLMQRKDGRVLISFYKGVHANPSALNVPEEPSPEQFAQVGKEVCDLI